MVGGDWFRHVHEFWTKCRDKDHFLFVKFEEVKKVRFWRRTRCLTVYIDISKIKNHMLLTFHGGGGTPWKMGYGYVRTPSWSFARTTHFFSSQNPTSLPKFSSHDYILLRVPNSAVVRSLAPLFGLRVAHLCQNECKCTRGLSFHYQDCNLKPYFSRLVL